jgi:hypothetical protein
VITAPNAYEARQIVTHPRATNPDIVTVVRTYHADEQALVERLGVDAPSRGTAPTTGTSPLARRLRGAAPARPRALARLAIPERPVALTAAVEPCAGSDGEGDHRWRRVASGSRRSS